MIVAEWRPLLEGTSAAFYYSPRLISLIDLGNEGVDMKCIVLVTVLDRSYL
jgi:hypothetical protein